MGITRNTEKELNLEEDGRRIEIEAAKVRETKEEKKLFEYKN